MTWPRPQPGLGFRYAYLWRREALAGQEEGVKDRPCALVLAVNDEQGHVRIYALPITHSEPAPPDEGIELPALTADRLGLNGARSWIVVTEANVFAWPGPDLRPLPGKPAESVAFGILPPNLFKRVLDRFATLSRERRSQRVYRTQ